MALGDRETVRKGPQDDVTGADMQHPVVLKGRSIGDLFEITGDPFRALGSALVSLSSG